jgi:hypothetical protein
MSSALAAAEILVAQLFGLAVPLAATALAPARF